MEYPGKTRGCKSCGKDTKKLFYMPGMAVLGKRYCAECVAPVAEPEPVFTVGFYGYSVDTTFVPCEGKGCTRKVQHDFASHGGDMFDPDLPALCNRCIEASRAAVAVGSGMSYEAADIDDLPFD